MRVRAVGKLDLLPDSLLSAIRVAEEATAAHRALLREKAKQGEDLDARAVPLRARPARPRPHHPHQRRGPALGLPALAEPAFRRIDFLRTVRAFQQRDRRFGS